jgi:hypothetical protein
MMIINSSLPGLSRISRQARAASLSFEKTVMLEAINKNEIKVQQNINMMEVQQEKTSRHDDTACVAPGGDSITAARAFIPRALPSSIRERLFLFKINIINQCFTLKKEKL